MSYIGLILLIVFSVVDPGKGPGGGGGGLFLDQTEAQRAEKTFSDTPGPPFCQGLDDCPPLSPLSEGLDLSLVFTENAKKDSANIQPS